MLTPPYVIKEDSNGGAIQTSVFSELLEQRIIYFADEVNEDTAATINGLLLYLFAKDKELPITIYINSPGGAVYSGNSIIDTMDLIKSSGCIIKTICCGMCASYGAVILTNGSAGHRCALKRSTIMIHQPLSGVEGQASDIEIVALEVNRVKKVLSEVIASNSGKDIEEVIKDCDRDNWISAEDALPGKYGKKGLIDEIIEKL